MTTILIVAGVIVFLFISYFKGQDMEKEEKVKAEEQRLPTVKELVDSVNTREEFKVFEKKYDQVTEIMREDFENKHNEKMYLIYEKAFSKIDDKLCAQDDKLDT